MILAIVPQNLMISTLVTILIAVLIIALIWWVINRIGIPEPFKMIVEVLLAIIAIVWLCNLAGFWHWR